MGRRNMTNDRVGSYTQDFICRGCGLLTERTVLAGEVVPCPRCGEVAVDEAQNGPVPLTAREAAAVAFLAVRAGKPVRIARDHAGALRCHVAGVWRRITGDGGIE